MFETDDTIVAVSTPAGSAARAIVRLSGPGAMAAAEAVFTSAGGRLAELGGFRSADGLVRLPEAGIELPGRAYVFRSPRSYTRQDVVELHIPGPASATTALTAALVEAGARPAQPGEFTARAFFAGRIDLSAAEAVADVIGAADDAQLRSAMAALGGSVCQLCGSATADLVDVLAEVEASIDLAEEDIALTSASQAAARLSDLAGRLGAIADRASNVPDAAACPRVVIAGRPNVGKSSLLNALTGSDRAIVSALAGTTRDVLGAPMHLPDAGTVQLLDAAGFVRPDDTLAAAADNAARRAVARADVLVFVADLTGPDPDAEGRLLAEVRSTNPNAPLVLVANKADATSRPDAQERLARLATGCGLTAIPVSATRGEGLGALTSEIAERLDLSASRGGDALGLHERQKRCLRSAADAADRASDLLASAEEVADVAELVAVELRDALAWIGAISGQTTTEDILARIFARFCVGK